MLVPLSGTVKIARWLFFFVLVFFLTLNGLHHGHKVASNQKLSECRQHYATPVCWMNAVLHKSGIKCVADLFMRSQTNVDCREARMPTHTHTPCLWCHTFVIVFQVKEVAKKKPTLHPFISLTVSTTSLRVTPIAHQIRQTDLKLYLIWKHVKQKKNWVIYKDKPACVT